MCAYATQTGIRRGNRREQSCGGDREATRRRKPDATRGDVTAAAAGGMPACHIGVCSHSAVQYSTLLDPMTCGNSGNNEELERSSRVRLYESSRASKKRIEDESRRVCQLVSAFSCVVLCSVLFYCSVVICCIRVQMQLLFIASVL